VKQIFITGAAGFIGSTLADALLAQGKQVVGWDNFSTGQPKFIEAARANPNFKLIEGDNLDLPSLTAAMRGCDTVFHLAAIAGVSSYDRLPLRTFDVNLEGTRNVLDAALQLGVRRVINFSTSEVYGAHALHVDEGSPTVQGPAAQARWIYAVSKLAGDHLALAYYREHGLPVVSIRPFNIYGPRQVGEGAVQSFSLRALRGEPLVISGDGSQLRAWCYVEDFVDGVLRASRTPEAIGKIFNLGNPHCTVSVLKLAELVRIASGRDVPLVHRERDDAEVELRIPNIDRARHVLGWSPQIGLEDGIDRAVGWYRQVLMDAPLLLAAEA
jgi:UDP-glucose 4-epimerase